MDNNPLTPKKIQRLMYFAEDKSFSSMLRSGNFEHSSMSHLKPASITSVPDKSSNYESSSGLLDLDRCEGFGESGIGNITLNKSTTSFYPGEMTGRSTGTDQSAIMPSLPAFTEYGRFSDGSIQCLEKKLDEQTSNVNQIMRQSIANSYSFHSKRDLTADEASLVMREAPVNPNMINMDLKETTVTQETDPIELSMGSYFQTRCIDFKALLPSSDSPKRDFSNMSIGLGVEEPLMPPPPVPPKHIPIKETIHYTMDTTLDSVPVRQPRNVPKMADLTGILKQPTSNKENIATPTLPSLQELSSTFKQNCILMDPSKQHLRSSVRHTTEESLKSEEESLSISNIRGLLEKDSTVDLENLLSYIKSADKKPRGLNKLDLNTEANRQRLNQDMHVTLLKDMKKSDTTSSAGTVDTVICKPSDIPAVVVTQCSVTDDNVCMDDKRDSVITSSHSRSKSKSPSKSRSTMSTVQENLAGASFKSSSSPSVSCAGVGKTSHNSSPNNQYKELDKSVDWQELLRSSDRLKSESIAKDVWAEIKTGPVVGFVGVCTPAVIGVSSLTDSWLTARLEFIKTEHEVSIDLPRFPVLLPPGKTEHFTIQVTSNREIKKYLRFILFLKESSIEGEIEIEGQIEVELKMPTLQAVSSDRVNKVTFPAVAEGHSLTRSIVLLSDCSADLQLDLRVIEGCNLFSISAVHEISKSEVTKQLLEHQVVDNNKHRNRRSLRQLCRLSNGNAIKVTVTFSAPKLADLNADKIAMLNGALIVSLIGVDTPLKKVDLEATVGTVELTLMVPYGKLHLTNELTMITVRNTGSVTGSWKVKFKDAQTTDCGFRVSSNCFQLDAGVSITFKLFYQGAQDILTENVLIFEEVNSGNKTFLELSGGKDQPKQFPIKTSCKMMSWVRNGTKEISLKNYSDKKVHLKCKITGDGFYMDVSRGGGSNTVMVLSFAPNERRNLSIVFQSTSNLPTTATLYLALDKDMETSRKVFLYGTSAGEGMCWSGALVTYGNTALVRALTRQPIELTLTNKSNAPAFMCASLHFNLQYRSAERTSVVEPARAVAGARGSRSVRVLADWARVERRARVPGPAALSALATLTVLTGAETTRRRILKVIKEDMKDTDISTLPPHLQQLIGTFEGEDPSVDNLLEDFHETKASLDELVEGIYELTAQIDIPQDLPEDNTILITDDTVLDHHTIAD